MISSKKKIALAAMAGAAAVFATNSAHASLVITDTKTANVTTQDGVFDRYVFNLTSIGGLDAVSGPLGQDPEVLLFEGTFTAVGSGAALLNPGANVVSGTSTSNPNWDNYIFANNTTANLNKVPNDPSGNFSSFVNLPKLSSNSAHTGVTNASFVGSSSAPTTIHGEATAFTGHWFVQPASAAGPAGGIEPSVNGGKIATIFVTPGMNVSFSGDYGTYNATGTQTLSFTTVAPGGGKIISLTAGSAGSVGGAAFTGGTYNPNVPTAGVVNVIGTGTGFIRGELNGISGGTGSKTGQTGVKFEDATGTAVDPGIEYIGLNLADGANAQGSAQFNADIQALISDINSGTAGFGATDAYATITTGTNDSLAGAPLGTQIAALGLNAGKVGAAQYDVVIGVPSVNGGNSLLGLDLTQDSALPAGLTVTDIAAVPEPASAAGLLIGASGLLLGRRKRKA